MEKSGLVSIIIPVYNVRPYLVEALDSVLCQTYENLEFIIVDDGSTDGSEAICDEYAEKDARVRVIHQENRGLSAARNAGLERMTGEAVAFLDPDDAFHESFIETMMSAMIRGEGIDLVVCGFTVHRTIERMGRADRGREVPLIAPGTYDRVGALRALADGTINVAVWNKLYRRELWSAVRFPEGHVYEDVDTTFRILDRCGRISVINRPLYLHRRRPGSITDTVSRNNILDIIRASKHLLSFVEAHMPEVFTEEQLNRRRRLLFVCMITRYVRGYGRMRGQEDAFLEDLREQIIAKGAEIEIDTVSLRVRVAYIMIRTCPGLLRLAYPVYRSARLAVLRITGR